MNRNWLIALGVLIAVAAAGFFFIRKPAIKTAGMPVPESTVEEKTVNTEPAREITVTGTEYSFNPSSITVKKGEKIRLTFINAGSTLHNLVIDDLGVETKKIGPGKSDTIEFSVESDANLTYYCSISNHQSLGMEGELKIEP
jgi:cytochrome c oxidase subunit 2